MIIFNEKKLILPIRIYVLRVESNPESPQYEAYNHSTVTSGEVYKVSRKIVGLFYRRTLWPEILFGVKHLQLQRTKVTLYQTILLWSPVHWGQTSLQLRLSVCLIRQCARGLKMGNATFSWQTSGSRLGGWDNQAREYMNMQISTYAPEALTFSINRIRPRLCQFLRRFF